MWQRSFLAFFLFFGFTATAAKPPAGYNHFSAAVKRDWHVAEAKGSPYRFGVPGSVRTLCAQVLALPGFLWERYLRRTTESGSGYPDDWWRRLTGKAIHVIGATAPGEVTITEPMLGLPPGTYPTTFRFSLANAYVPRVPGGEFRPGLASSLHQDGAKPDINFFTMPPSGLTGFAQHQNPFEHNFAGHLELPGKGLRRIAAWTFGRVVTDVFVQKVSDDFGSIIMVPVGDWADRYERTAKRAYSFVERLAAMEGSEEMEEVFQIFTYDGTTIGRRVGTVRFSGPFLNSREGDRWLREHQGFEKKE